MNERDAGTPRVDGPLPGAGARRRRIVLVAIGLALATVASWWVGEGHLQRTPAWAVALVFGLAGAKAAAIALDFMELRHAPTIWRRAVLGWVVLIVGLIALLAGATAAG